MNNEEKAMNLANFDPNMYELHKDYIGQEDAQNKEKYEIALEMAEWKDKEFKEYLEKKKYELPSPFLKTAEVRGIIEGKEHIIDEIISELFNIGN